MPQMTSAAETGYYDIIRYPKWLLRFVSFTHKTRLKPKLTYNINCTDLPCCLLQERHVWVTQYKTYLMLNAENSCAAQSFSGNWYILFNSNFVAIAKNTLYGSIKNYQFFFYSKNH